MNSGGSDGHYTFRRSAEMAPAANQEGFIAIQIETANSVEDAERIAAIDGVDLLFVGPSDLSQDLGVIGQPGHASVWAAIDRVAEVCAKHNKPWGIVPADPDYARRCVEKGCRMLTCGSDTHAMRLGILALKAKYQFT